MTQTILFFDTETTGLPKSMKAPVEDIDNWPRMVQLAWHKDDVDHAAAEGVARPAGVVVAASRHPLLRAVPVERAQPAHCVGVGYGRCAD